LNGYFNNEIDSCDEVIAAKNPGPVQI